MFAGMELKMVRGCVCDSLTIDNREEVTVPDADKAAYIRAIARWIENHPEAIELNDFMQYICEACGEYEHTDKPCEECGDYIETYTLSI